MEDEAHFICGLHLLLTCKLDECEAHFTAGSSADASQQQKARSAFGHALVTVVRFLATFDDQDLDKTHARLNTAQRLANGAKINSGLSFSRFFASSSRKSLEEEKKQEYDNAVSNLEMELLSADIGLVLALVQFAQETTVGIMNATLSIRKSLKVYQRASKELRELGSQGGRSRRSSSGDFTLNLDAERRKRLAKHASQLVVFDDDVYFDAIELGSNEDSNQENNDGAESGYGPVVSRTASLEDRVRASSKLGTGLFHLVFSFVPRRFSGLLGTAIGFDGTPDRKKGLHCLRVCIDQGTSRSPLAALILLAFHSAMLIFARGISDEGDEKEAMEVLQLCLCQYPDSALFRFFEGRLLRGQANLRRAREVFEVAQKCSRNIDNLADLCLYERAWCTALMQGRSREAAHQFAKVARSSNWTFFAYAAACFYLEDAFRVLCLNGDEEMKGLSMALGVTHPNEAAIKSLKDALAWFKIIPAMHKQASHVPLERFAVARSTMIMSAWDAYARGSDVASMSKETMIRIMCRLFWPAMEVAYMWNAIFQIDNKSYRRLELDRAVRVFSLVVDGEDRRLRSIEAMYHLYQAALLREERLFSIADDHLNRICSSPNQHNSKHAESSLEERWPIEFAKYEHGLCAWEQGDKKRAVQWWGSVKDSGHLLDQRLQFRVKWALRRAEQHQVS